MIMTSFTKHGNHYLIKFITKWKGYVPAASLYEKRESNLDEVKISSTYSLVKFHPIPILIARVDYNWIANNIH